VGNVQGLIEGRHLTAEVGGVAYKYRRLNTLIALEIQGVGVFGGLEAAELADRKKDGDWKPTPQDRRDFHEFIRRHLERCLISPRLGSETSDEADTVCMDDLGEDAYELFALIKGSAPDPANFTPSSPESEATR